MTEPITSLIAITAGVDAITAFVASATALFSTVGAFLVTAGTFIGTVVGVCSVIARFMPPPEGVTKMAKFHKLINSWAQNTGYAENKNA